MEEDTIDMTVKFKRRKVTHTKRTRLEVGDDDAVAAPQSPNTETIAENEEQATEGDETSATLKEILRNRKRPRDRLREAAARAELTKAQALHRREQDAPKQGYAERFVPQTGQVVDRDDEQITEYIDARLAEKNHRLYGWPIPQHLAANVAALASDERTQTTVHPSTKTHPITDASLEQGKLDNEKGQRLAAGMGKLQEIDLGPASTSRAEAAWKKLQGDQAGEQPAQKVRLGRDGKPRRQPKRRNSEDLRRDAMVDAVLSEAKLDYFDEQTLNKPDQGSANNDEALVEQFRQEFLESIESRQQRKPAAPAHGVKEAPKGPKLGGSRSARAAMQAQREQAAKSKR